MRSNASRRSRSAGRFTPPGTVQPTPPRLARGACACPACVAEASGAPFDFEAEWARTLSLVERRGTAIQYVTAPPGEIAWAYTIGRLRRGRPELVVLGVSPETAAAMLNTIDADWDDISIPTDGICAISSDSRQAFALLPVPDVLWDSDFLLGADRDARAQGLTEYREALQVIWRDSAGAFPWDPEFAYRRGVDQPILGFFSNLEAEPDW